MSQPFPSSGGQAAVAAAVPHSPSAAPTRPAATSAIASAALIPPTAALGGKARQRACRLLLGATASTASIVGSRRSARQAVTEAFQPAPEQQLSWAWGGAPWRAMAAERETALDGFWYGRSCLPDLLSQKAALVLQHTVEFSLQRHL